MTSSEAGHDYRMIYESVGRVARRGSTEGFTE